LSGAAGAATSVSKSNALASVTVSADPLGIDVAQWINPATLTAIEPLLKAAGINQLHYSGGVTADQYDWSTEQDISNCSEAEQTPAAFEDATCVKTDPLSFDKFAASAGAIGAQTSATVNYGTGSADLAAAWVTHAAANDEPVAQWSIGNESYGCWESDWWLTQPPLDDTDYVPNETGCPWNLEATQAAGVTDTAESYAENALPFMQEMTTADPSIQIGVPWAFDGSVGGAGVPSNMNWNTTILQADAQYISFVEAHWYPFSFGGIMGKNGNATAQQVLQSVESIPNEYSKMHAELAKYDSKATVTIGETGVSYLATNVPCTPTGALFAAGDVLEWLSSGAKTVDWWPMDTAANLTSACTAPEEAMFTSNGSPDSVYWGYLLASQLAQPNAQLSALTTSNPTQVLGFQSVLPDGRTAVELINTNTSTSEKVTVNASLTGNLSTMSYVAANQNAADSNIVSGTSTAAAVAGGVTLPPQSILILKSHLPTQLTLHAAANTLKPGAKVALSGTLTLDGAAAQAGTAVKVYRRVSGSTVNSATLTATTAAGGTFTVTDTPPGRGNYSYVAQYAGTSLLASASASYAVHVTALTPSLKLAVSAKSVKPGRTVTVTATLGATHGDRTLLIYAQIKGGGRKLKKRATVNAKGQLSIVFTMRVNTTFSVNFLGDNWYSPASTTVLVKA
jgi:hypothetical protein